MLEENISEGDILKAVKDVNFFKILTPENMLKVMMLDMIENGSIKADQYAYWESMREQTEKIGQKARLDRLIEVLELEKPSGVLRSMLSTGLMEFCIPLCFPLKNRLSQSDLLSIIDDFDKCSDELPLRIAFFLYPFDLKSIRNTLAESGFDPDMISSVLFSLKNYEDFILIKTKESLKKFIYKNGIEHYDFINRFAGQLNLTLDLPVYKLLSKEYLLEQIKRMREPIFPEDLDICEEDLEEIGIVERVEVKEMMKILTEYCHGKPLDNRKAVLLAKARGFKNSRIKRAFRNVRWIK